MSGQRKKNSSHGRDEDAQGSDMRGRNFSPRLQGGYQDAYQKHLQDIFIDRMIDLKVDQAIRLLKTYDG